MSTSKTTKLEAVNLVLRNAGETPVTSLTSQAGVQSVMAEETVDEVSREIQTVGWDLEPPLCHLPLRH